VIVGGLGQDYLKDFYCIDLLHLKSTLLTPENEELFQNGIAFHSSCSIAGPRVKLYPDYKRTIQNSEETGIFLYGGKDSTGEIYDKVHLLSTCEIPHKIIEVQTYGK